MYVNYGNDLFLPEGDDYSKSEFNENIENIEAEGRNLLNRLREEQSLIEAKNKECMGIKESSNKVKNNSIDKQKPKENKKLSYKEILDSVVASK